MILMQVW